MRLFKSFRVLFFLLFLSFTFKATAQQTGFSENQKALLREALRAAVSTEKNLPDYNELKDKKKIYLLDKMIFLDNMDAPAYYMPKEVVPEFENVKFELISEKDLKNKKKNQDILYLRLAQINEPDQEYAVVHMLAQWRLGKKSKKKGFTYRESKGYSMLFKKTEKGWEFQKVVNLFMNLLDQPK
ncbi:hypothetical protein [Adhaeribacter soli]|uniref:Nuclear transport factor 2 family protein n=1 Tax=Adhaeribacter soli TaxID=2607655 RepID=A0A5N1IRL0_9BACT|nr:hypothetical protein [Adhaeribacter soli]KAA9332734.1 hypothetical protein F0P94_12055 [Adhaeribacter soli]